jgi:putative ABC transport system permease protein
MLRNYIIVAIRNFWRNKSFSFINIFGLALGTACSLLIFLWVKDERSVDKFNSNTKDLYSVYERVFSEGKVDAGPWTPGLLAQELKRVIPEIKFASGFWNTKDETLFEVGEKKISLQGAFADSDFFKMFDYHLLEGNAESALSMPDDIAVSRKMAESFFGSTQSAFGKTLRVNNNRVFRISAVFENAPTNASQQFDYVFNYRYLLESVGWLKEWIYRGTFAYIQLRPNADPTRVETRIKNFLSGYLTKSEGAGFHLELGLQRYDEMYLNSTFAEGIPAGGRIEYVRLFSIVAIFILLIACINFMNLATARSVKRAKEVGIRKTVGALRFSLIMQFIGEAILLAFFAVIISLVLVKLLLPPFNMLTAKQIQLPLSSISFWLSIVTLILITGFVSGSYPALFLSSLKPVKVLKGSLKFTPPALLFRKGLVVFQFVLSIVLIICTIIIAQQVNYVRTKNLGFNKENLIYVPFQGGLTDKYKLFKQEMTGMPGIADVSRSDQMPTDIWVHAYDLDWAGKNPATKTVVIHIRVGYGFLKMLHVPVIQGRDFSRDFPTDSTGYIVNETALKLIGYKNPIGQPLSIFQRKGTIIGVVKDFHYRSLRDPIEPLVIFLGENINWGYTIIKTEPGKTKEAIASLEKVFSQLEPRFTLRYSFADEQYQKLYDDEQTISKLSDCCSFLAIFISCLGLLGLTMFTAEQRTKEIGVRKVIGASIKDILLMLTKDIIVLVFLASVIATPVAWFAMNSWLGNYAYRTPISLWVFLATAALAILVALTTISYQALKSAMANPVNSLRSE